MSEERSVLRVPLKGKGPTSTISVKEAMELAENVEDLEDAQLKARIASILDRGIIIDRGQIDLPPEVYGEWVHNDSIEIARMQALGFVIDKEFAKDKALHSDGTDTAILGDTVFMVCSKRTKEIIDLVRHERFLKQNPVKGPQAEEKNYSDNPNVLDTVNTSSHLQVGPDAIEDAELAAVRENIPQNDEVTFSSKDSKEE